jgi:hypothetical protein
MSTGYLVYELLAAQAGVLLIATVAVGLATLLAGWRPPGARASVRLDIEAGARRIERLAWPAAPPRQADPDATDGHRPRAPDRTLTAAA